MDKSVVFFNPKFIKDVFQMCFRVVRARMKRVRSDESQGLRERQRDREETGKERERAGRPPVRSVSVRSQTLETMSLSQLPAL